MAESEITGTELELAFMAAFRIIQAAGEAEGVFFGDRADNVVVYDTAVRLGLGGATDELAALRAQG